MTPFQDNGRHIAVAGATGAVGREIFRTLERRNFPVASLRALASSRSAGKTIDTPWGPITVEDLDTADFSGVEIAFFSAGGSVSKKHAPRAAKAGAYVIDNTSAFRMHPEVPLVIPEINSHAIPDTPGIIANPNCSTSQMVLPLAALHALSPLTRVVVATYQSASGAGQKGIDELLEGTRSALDGQFPKTSTIHAKPLAFNCVPQIGSFSDDAYTTEELKMVHETRKIMELPNLPVAATCIRVPVMRSHSEVVHVETESAIDLKDAADAINAYPNLTLVDDPASAVYPTPRSAEGEFDTYIGRLRRDLSHPRGLTFWCVSDNLLKGAAFNAVQIAEAVQSSLQDRKAQG